MKSTENAPRRLSLNHATFAAILCAASTGLLASEYPEMKRSVPVPADQPIPIFDFIRPPAFAQVQLNHTGTTVGAIVPGNADARSLVTYNLTSQLLDGVSAPQGDQEISSFEWLDGDRLAYLDTFGKGESVGVLFLSSAGKLGEAEPVGAQGSAGITQLLGNTPEDRSQFLVNLKGFDFRYDHPELINAKAHGSLITRYPELKTDHGFNISFWPNKVGILEFGVTQEDGIRALHHLEGDNWVKSPIDVDEIEVFDSGDNPGEIVALGQRDGKAPRPLEFFDAATGQAKDVLLQDKGYDFYGRLYRDPVSHNIVGASYDRAAPHVVWFTEAYRDLQKLLDGLFPNQVVRIVDMDDAGKVVLISSWSDRQPAVYSWVNLETHKSGLIKNSAPWIDPKRMRPMGIIKFDTAEGRQLDAYITLPAGATKKNPPPMVVIPRTTTNGRATWGFDPEVQYYASRGYAVLQPNHRGSNGYGWMFPEIERWDYRKMSDDIASAVKKAVSMGLVDGKRVAIIGNNFGGYLAASGAAFEPGVYKCAVAISSYYDFGKYIKEDNYLKFSDPDYSRDLYKLGDPTKDPAKFDSFSPLANAGQIHSPMLIAWGERDSPELRSQSSDMAAAVQHSGVHSETLYYLNDGQSIRYLDHQTDLNQHIEAFLQQNL